MSGSNEARAMIDEGALESIVHRVTQEVWQELARKGITIPATPASLPDGTVRIDMSRYRTPLLTERAIAGLHPRSNNVAVPKGTIVTPRAKELLREKNIGIVYE
jgi:hypothetical protein